MTKSNREDRLLDAWLWLHAVATQMDRLQAGWEAAEASFTLPLPPPGMSVAQVRIDAHLLVVAADHLATSMSRLGGWREMVGDLEPDLRARIKVARNFREHWDETRDAWAQGKQSGAAGKYLREFPGAQPGEIRWELSATGLQDLILFGVLSLRRLSADIDRLKVRVAAHVQAIAERRRQSDAGA